MDISYKKTDTRRCVPFNSCHPKQRKKNIPSTLARRIYTIVENNEVRKKFSFFNNLAFVTTFNPNNKNVLPLIQTAFKSPQQSYETKECFKDIKLIKSQRQPPSLKKLLTWAIKSNKKERCSKKCDYIKDYIAITLKKTVFVFSKQQGIYFALKKIWPERVAI